MPACDHCASSETGATDPRFRRILWLALAINALMFLVELTASWLSGSMALQADALDFLGDSFNYAISLAVVGMGLRARARAALVKGATMAAFGLWVVASTAYRLWAGVPPPDASVMGVVGLLALAANVGVAIALFRYRGGDSNMRSIWLCSRNDALGNIAVIGAAAGVFATGSHLPDLLVAAMVAGLSLSAAVQVTRQAMGELDLARRAGPALPLRGGHHAHVPSVSVPPSDSAAPDSPARAVVAAVECGAKPAEESGPGGCVARSRSRVLALLWRGSGSRAQG